MKEGIEWETIGVLVGLAVACTGMIIAYFKLATDKVILPIRKILEHHENSLAGHEEILSKYGSDLNVLKTDVAVLKAEDSWKKQNQSRPK